VHLLRIYSSACTVGSHGVPKHVVYFVHLLCINSTACTVGTHRVPKHVGVYFMHLFAYIPEHVRLVPMGAETCRSIFCAPFMYTFQCMYGWYPRSAETCRSIFCAPVMYTFQSMQIGTHGVPKHVGVYFVHFLYIHSRACTVGFIIVSQGTTACLTTLSVSVAVR
jgi:hypothetical protein